MTFQYAELHRNDFIKYHCDLDNLIVLADLSSVEQYDSAGLACLIHMHRLCKKKSQTLQLDGLSTTLLALVQFYGLTPLLLNGERHFG